MSLKANYAKLHSGSKELFARWCGVTEHWQDENRRRFEKKYITTLQSELRKTQLAMERMDTVLNQVRRDCK